MQEEYEDELERVVSLVDLLLLKTHVAKTKKRTLSVLYM